MGADFRFDARRRPEAWTRGCEDGRDGVPLPWPCSEQYKAGWYHGYTDQLRRELRAYNARHGTNYEPRGPY
jgi:hypothetical protein